VSEYKKVNGKIEVWNCTNTYDESEVKIVHCCKEFLIHQNANFFICTCGRRHDVDREGGKLK
jgi:hypothetical protein